MRILILTLLFSLNAFANEGQDRGNGGDEYAKEFIEIGRDLAEQLVKDPLPQIDGHTLLKAIESTRVNSKAKLSLRGNDVDAINLPQNNPPQIIVSRASWDRMATQEYRRAFLVLHEYLGILGIDDSRYQVSSLLDRAAVCGRQAPIREYIENYFKKSCYRMIRDDLLYIEEMNFGSQYHPLDLDSLKAEDLAGLKRLRRIRFYNVSPLSLFSDTFRSTPNLEYIWVSNPSPNIMEARPFRSLSNLKGVTLGEDFALVKPVFISPIPHDSFSSVTLGYFGVYYDTEASVGDLRWVNSLFQKTASSFSLRLRVNNWLRLNVEPLKNVIKGSEILFIQESATDKDEAALQDQMLALKFKCKSYDERGISLSCTKQ